MAIESAAASHHTPRTWHYFLSSAARAGVGERIVARHDVIRDSSPCGGHVLRRTSECRPRGAPAVPARASVPDCPRVLPPGQCAVAAAASHRARSGMDESAANMLARMQQPQQHAAASGAA